MRLTVIGTGYLGATHAACLAELGFDVLGVDSDPEKIDMLRRGIVPFAEPGLEEILERHTRSGRLRFTTDLTEATAFGDVHFVCVGTPQSGGSMAADLTAVNAVVHTLAAHAIRDFLVIGKSTVPVGTAQQLTLELNALVRDGVTASVAWNPEFLREGHGVEDTLHPDRLVFGVTTDRGGAGAAPDLRHADHLGCPRPRHRPGHCRARQGRCEHVPRHEDLVHQRDGGGQRRLGRRRRGAGRHPR